MCLRCWGLGLVGKYAAVVWRNVQVAKPSASESGGHSGGELIAVGAADAVVPTVDIESECGVL